jgi:membrane-associated phospholipid phosphatase
MSDEDRSANGGIDRRGLLQGLAATGTLSALGLGSGAATETAAAAGSGPGQSKRERRAAAQRVRRTAMRDLVSPYRSSLSRFPAESTDPIEVDGEYVDVYTKGLPGVGSYDAEEYERRVVRPLTDPEVPLSEIPQEDPVFRDEDGPRRLVAPNAATQFPNDGMDSWMGTMPPAPAYDSLRTAAELIDCYWMAQFRDVNLRELTEDPRFDRDGRSYTTDLNVIDFAVDEKLPWLDETAPFRGSFPGSKRGPCLSQFYTHRADLGNLRIRPTVIPFVDDHLIQYAYQGCSGYPTETFVTAQAGHFRGSAEPGGKPARGSSYEGETLRWISTGRELASLVRDELSVQHYVMATAQLAGWGASLDGGMPYTDSERVLPYERYGGAGLVDLITRAAHNALAAAWYHKWGVHRRLRPETYGGHVHERLSDAVDSNAEGYPIPTLLLESTAVEETAANQSYTTDARCAASDTAGEAPSYLLPQAYPEGAPQHPAYPSGHSVLAGAAVTVLKTFFADDRLTDLFADSEAELRQPPGPDDDEPVPYDGPDADDLTVHSELNKLADNVGTARIWAGVHYWSDHTYGALLGEQMAVATLLDTLKERYGGSGPAEPTFTPLRPETVSTDSEEKAELSLDTLETLRQANTTR